MSPGAPGRTRGAPGRALAPVLLLGGLAALGLCASGLARDRAGFFHAYLIGYLFWLNIALGGLVVVMLQHQIPSRWGFAVRRVLEAAAATIPLLALLFVPLAFGLRDLYEWARPEAVARDPLLSAKSAYLNPAFFLGRAAAYFALWSFLAVVLTRWSRRQDETGEVPLTSRKRATSGVGIVAYVITMTLASVDWILSLDARWYSSLFGVIVMIGQGLDGICFSIVIAVWLAKVEPLRRLASPALWQDLGNLLLAFVILWAYAAMGQYLIIWSGNLPEEITGTWSAPAAAGRRWPSCWSWGISSRPSSCSSCARSSGARRRSAESRWRCSSSAGSISTGSWRRRSTARSSASTGWTAAR
jgi:predicted secreted protein